MVAGCVVAFIEKFSASSYSFRAIFTCAARMYAAGRLLIMPRSLVSRASASLYLPPHGIDRGLQIGSHDTARRDLVEPRGLSRRRPACSCSASRLARSSLRAQIARIDGEGSAEFLHRCIGFSLCGQDHALGIVHIGVFRDRVSTPDLFYGWPCRTGAPQRTGALRR